MSVAFRERKKFKTIHGKRMAYIEEGSGDPIVFLHGNPTSSYLWRNVMPHLQGRGRLIAPDLIGMGDSEKLDDSGPDRYTYVEHREYLFSLLDELDLDANVTLVIHDWGSALGFDWAFQHQEAVRGIAYMEAIVRIPKLDAFREPTKGLFESLRSPKGEKMVLEKNFFVEKMLPGAILRKLSEEEMNEYRRPFAEPGEGRRPTLTWPRQIPFDGEPADVAKIVDAYAQWLASSEVPKLFINADPGSILIGAARKFCQSWPNQTEVTVKGTHFIQEDSADEIGTAIADWLP